jgi:coenzyme F420-reducing hydrogenase beta subunit
MKADAEGFLYPEVDETTCIDCGLCERVCPVLRAGEDVPFSQAAYLLQYKNEKVRRQSTSGGAFTAIARYVLDRGGIVYGAAFDDRLRVHHTSAISPKGLQIFRNSKYVQSDTEKTFTQVRDHLRTGRLVCYSGTPCQIEGLLSFLEPAGTEGSREELLDRLVTVDVVCHAVPSPLVWERYLEMQREKLGAEIADAKFRDKHFGYNYSTMTLLDDSGEERYVQGIDTDQMLRAFFSNICDRPSCYDCAFKKRYRKSDFTIWDCYPVYAFDKKLDDDRGTSRVLIHSDKGRRIFEEVRQRCRVLEVEPDRLTAGVREMFHSVDSNPRREEFFEDAACMEARTFFNKYFPMTARVKLERTARIVCYRTGVYALAKRAARKILKKD